MENNLKMSNLVHCYKSLKKHREHLYGFEVGKHLGYMEAGLHNFGYLETVDNNGVNEVKREMKPAAAWYKKPKLEDYEEAIVRMTEKMFTANDIKF
jgi:hypothetical protein